MLRPINISPINTSTDLEFRCEYCDFAGKIKLEDSVVNTDNLGNPVDISELEGHLCPRPECQKDLLIKPEKKIAKQIKNIFRISGVVTFLQGTHEYLTVGNCRISKVSISDDRVELTLVKIGGTLEATAAIRVQNEYKNDEKDLLNLIGNDSNILGMTIGELESYEINYSTI